MGAVNRKALKGGMVLAISFFGVLALLFSPIFGKGRNCLVLADDMFNRLSKGSSYFIPSVIRSSEKFRTSEIDVVIRLDKPAQMNPPAKKLLAAAGVLADCPGAGIRITGNLKAVISRILADADDMFKNEGARVSGRYGTDEKKVLASWWNILKEMDAALRKQNKIQQAEMVSDVMRKAVEPAYNFYGIEARKVSEKAGLMTGLLVFYVAYTMWWGFAVFSIFEGLGLSMKKTKLKKEI